MRTVYQAEAFRPGELGSFGNATYMLLSQHQFPNSYDEKLDMMHQWDHDRIMSSDFEHGQDCFKRHTGYGELGLESWLRKASPNQILNFVKDILKADADVLWTGYRIMGSVHRGNGYPVWTLELFAKHSESATVVYDTQNAPCLIQGSRYAHL